jgi:acetyl-CoA decarbonylase/synthase complex subunit gamma
MDKTSKQKGSPQPCCGPDLTPERTSAPRLSPASFVIGTIKTAVGDIPQVSTDLTWSDRLGGWKVRWAIGRGRYRVVPGLYAVGQPSADSAVLVTANFKMSFDRLREQLGGRDLWILVLDTKGINVWCAAGKGTFGTEELLSRIKQVHLHDLVYHRHLILPQLGATGVSAHKVKNRGGWRINYGPVRAADLPTYLDSKFKATLEMRRIHFPLRERIILTPVELVQAAKYLLPVIAGFFLLSGISADGYETARLLNSGVVAAGMLLLAWIVGAAVTPALLPTLPGAAFSIKGALLGLIVTTAISMSGSIFLNQTEMIGWLFLVTSISSFLAMNFTGCSTYTSLSGVRREMKFAVPLQIAGAVIGLTLWVVARFV